MKNPTNGGTLWSWRSKTTSKDHPNSIKEFPAIRFLREKTEKLRKAAAGGPGFGGGAGCGAGLGFGLAGGLGFGHGGWPESQMKLVAGLGMGCGVGFGFGYGQGFGLGFGLDDVEDLFSSENNSDLAKGIFG